MSRLAGAKDLLKQTGRDWWDDRAPRLAAALSFYTLFALAPLLIIVMAVAGLVAGSDSAREAIGEQAQALFGDAGREAVDGLVDNAATGRSGYVGAAVGTVAFLFGASGVFLQLQDALNTAWEVRPKPPRSWAARIAKRLKAFTVVLGTGFLLLVSLALSAGLAAVATVGRGLPGSDLAWGALDLAVSVATVAVLFALLFRLLPDAVVAWRDAWAGALATSLMFSVGKVLLGLYLGRSATTSSFGAASAMAMLLLWVYYNAQLVLLGAEFTQAYARRRGQPIVPKPHAERIPDAGQDATPGA
jgi:membrane protein